MKVRRASYIPKRKDNGQGITTKMQSGIQEVYKK